MKEIYLDNSATTIVSESAAKKVYELLVEKYGNPSSLHEKGIEADIEINNARKIIASQLGCDSSEVFFTSGGTEANNIALLGGANARKRRGNRIVTTKIEHSSVLESAKQLENNGFEVIYLEPDSNGNIKEDNIYNAINEKTILVSTMMVNNELGNILPISNIKKIIKEKDAHAIFHVDTVQAFGKIPVKPLKIGADILSISAHKVHGPKGVGAIYISKGVKVLPLTFGGTQENKIRPGTQATSLIAGFGEAVNNFPNLKDKLKEVEELRDYLIHKIQNIDCIHINSTKNSLPYITNFSILGIKSETMLHYLGSKGIYVSSGSACAKGKKSHVLESVFNDKNIIDSTIRVSFSKYTTKDEIDIFIDAVKKGINTLVKSK